VEIEIVQGLESVALQSYVFIALTYRFSLSVSAARQVGPAQFANNVSYLI
jgi:hypothetical protein